MRKALIIEKPPEPELSQNDLEARLTENVAVRGHVEAQKGRLKRALSVPSSDMPSGDIIALMTETLNQNRELIGWPVDDSELQADKWARILLLDIRYGVPTNELNGEGFHITEAEVGEAPLCPDCQE